MRAWCFVDETFRLCHSFLLWLFSLSNRIERVVPQPPRALCYQQLTSRHRCRRRGGNESQSKAFGGSKLKKTANKEKVTKALIKKRRLRRQWRRWRQGKKSFHFSLSFLGFHNAYSKTCRCRCRRPRRRRHCRNHRCCFWFRVIYGCRLSVTICTPKYMHKRCSRAFHLIPIYVLVHKNTLHAWMVEECLITVCVCVCARLVSIEKLFRVFSFIFGRWVQEYSKSYERRNVCAVLCVQ